MALFSIPNGSYNDYGNRVRMTPDENFIMVAGRAENSAGTQFPMLWSVAMASTAPFTMTFQSQTSGSFTGAAGNGGWKDFGFIKRTRPGANPYNYDIVAGGSHQA